MKIFFAFLILLFNINIIAIQSENDKVKIERKEKKSGCDEVVVRVKDLEFISSKKKEILLTICQNGYYEVEYHDKRLNTNLMKVIRKIGSINGLDYITIKDINQHELLKKIDNIKMKKIEYSYTENSLDNYMEIRDYLFYIEMSAIFNPDQQKMEVDGKQQDFSLRYEVNNRGYQFSILGIKFYDEFTSKLDKDISIILAGKYDENKERDDKFEILKIEKLEFSEQKNYVSSYFRYYIDNKQELEYPEKVLGYNLTKTVNKKNLNYDLKNLKKLSEKAIESVAKDEIEYEVNIEFSGLKNKEKIVKFNGKEIKNPNIYKVTYDDKFFIILGEEKLYKNQEIKNVIEEINQIFEEK